jgi:hypothetical protein
LIAKDSTPDVEDLIAADQWKAAARLIFTEARTADKHEPDIVTGQAKAGFIQDALETINGTNPGSRSWLLMTVVKEAPSLVSDKRDELIRNALTLARARTNRISDNYLRSGDLARIALYHSAQGAENEAKAIFSEALAAAEAGLLEEGSGGFRQITEQMRSASPAEVKPWMLSMLQSSVKKEIANFPSAFDVMLSMIQSRSGKTNKTANPVSLAFACIDLVKVAGEIKSRGQIAFFVECATVSINEIDKTSMRKHATEKLAEMEFEVGYEKLILSDLPSIDALRKARAGNIEKSYRVIVSEFGENLYVDHSLTAYERVYSDAIKRGDLKTAQFFAERPVRQLLYYEVSVWRRLAEKQSEQGERKLASESYGRALSTVDRLNASPEVYDSDIRDIVNLGESLCRNGRQDEGHRTLLIAKSLLEKISEKRIDDRIEASILVSKSLWQLGIKTDAKKLIQQAYSDVHSYDTIKPIHAMQKAEWLVQIGQTISMFSESR